MILIAVHIAKHYSTIWLCILFSNFFFFILSLLDVVSSQFNSCDITVVYSKIIQNML